MNLNLFIWALEESQQIRAVSTPTWAVLASWLEVSGFTLNSGGIRSPRGAHDKQNRK